LYGTVCEDVHTGIMLNCNGWNSVYCDPPKPQFLGNSATNLNDLLIQGTRWSSGLLESGLIKICPLLKCPLRMSLLYRFCLTYITIFPLYCLPLWCLAIVPQICLLAGVPLYPKVIIISSPMPYNYYFFGKFGVDEMIRHLQHSK
jgi:cellulose synthase/poly-beta-1,6-N-acetylglucosamine synthase-like glycosyltransferase